MTCEHCGKDVHRPAALQRLQAALDEARAGDGVVVLEDGDDLAKLLLTALAVHHTTPTPSAEADAALRMALEDTNATIRHATEDLEHRHAANVAALAARPATPPKP